MRCEAMRGSEEIVSQHISWLQSGRKSAGWQARVKGIIRKRGKLEREVKRMGPEKRGRGG
jgi:hypothetical protein